MAYLPLSTANLPDPVIDPAQGSSPEDYFGTLLWSGDDNATRTVAVGQSGVTGDVNFTPDFSWVKRRNGATNGSDHMLLDAVRGVGTFNALSSNGNQAEGLTEAGSAWTNFGDIDSFTTDGFVVQKGSDPSHTLEGINQTGGTYVAWNWKANGSATLNDTGSIDSQVSANTTSGFSIVAWTGDGSEAATVGHGLGVEPSCIICKERTGGDWWHVWHKGLSSASHNMFLNNAEAERSPYFDGHLKNNGSSTFGFDSSTSNVNAVNESGITNIAYCFADVEGFSKFGSYTGNGDPDGTFVYTGFRPAWVMVKCFSNVGNWWLYDTARGTYNEINIGLVPSALNADTPGYPLDVLSNGFKWRTSNGDFNGSGRTYIYMAFAENPFKYSNAR